MAVNSFLLELEAAPLTFSQKIFTMFHPLKLAKFVRSLTWRWYSWIWVDTRQNKTTFILQCFDILIGANITLSYETITTIWWHWHLFAFETKPESGISRPRFYLYLKDSYLHLSRNLRISTPLYQYLSPTRWKVNSPSSRYFLTSRSSTPRMFLISLFVYRASSLIGIFDDSSDDLSSLKSFLKAMTSVMRVLISSSCSEIYFSLYILKTTFRF